MIMKFNTIENSPQNRFVIVGVPISIGGQKKIPQSIDPFSYDPYRIAPTYAHILGYYWRGAAGIIVLAESHERCSIVGTSRIILINTEASANDFTWLRIV